MTDGMNRDRTCTSMRHPSPCRDKTRHLTTEPSTSTGGRGREEVRKVPNCMSCAHAPSYEPHGSQVPVSRPDWTVGRTLHYSGHVTFTAVVPEYSLFHLSLSLSLSFSHILHSVYIYDAFLL